MLVADLVRRRAASLGAVAAKTSNQKLWLLFALNPGLLTLSSCLLLASFDFFFVESPNESLVGESISLEPESKALRFTLAFRILDRPPT